MGDRIKRQIGIIIIERRIIRLNIVKYYGCYDYNEEWYLIELILDVSASEIDWSNIFVPENETKKENWQVPYMEQYLDRDGTKKICKTYEEPKEYIKPCRVVFFIYKDSANVLSTPYGVFELSIESKVPERLESLVEFEID